MPLGPGNVVGEPPKTQFGVDVSQGVFGPPCAGPNDRRRRHQQIDLVRLAQQLVAETGIGVDRGGIELEIAEGSDARKGKQVERSD